MIKSYNDKEEDLVLKAFKNLEMINKYTPTVLQLHQLSKVEKGKIHEILDDKHLPIINTEILFQDNELPLEAYPSIKIASGAYNRIEFLLQEAVEANASKAYSAVEHDVKKMFLEIASGCDIALKVFVNQFIVKKEEK